MRFDVVVSNQNRSGYDPSGQEPLLTVREVAQRLSLSDVTVRRWIRCGRLRPVRFGRAVRLTEEDVAALVRRGISANDDEGPEDGPDLAADEKNGAPSP